MSDVTDLADAEAIKAEAENPNEEAAEPTPEPDATPDEEDEAAEHDEQDAQQVEDVPAEPEALNEKQLNALFGKLDRERDRHDKRVRDIMGADAEALLPCPLCDVLTPGYVLPMPNTPERFPAVRAFMGDAQPAEYQQDPNTRTCQTCAGEGMVATGSKVDGQAQLVCTDCGGKGWQGARPSVVTAAPTGPMAIPDANGQDTPTPQGPEPPEAAKLRELGYTLIQPVGT